MEPTWMGLGALLGEPLGVIVALAGWQVVGAAAVWFALAAIGLDPVTLARGRSGPGRTLR